MKAVISSTYDDIYLFNLPIVTWCWNKLGIDVICFMPTYTDYQTEKVVCYRRKIETLNKYLQKFKIKVLEFSASEEKETTYAQCSRLFAGALCDEAEEILITSDVDMAVFKIPPYRNSGFTVFGVDLVPPRQYPMCYITARAMDWCYIFDDMRTYQNNLDRLLGSIKCYNFRGNYWGKDQEEAFRLINSEPDTVELTRARPGTQFASNRLDRDDAYMLDRLSPDIIDFHMPRPGWTDENFNKILTVLKYFYPNEDFQWLIDYKNEYINLL